MDGIQHGKARESVEVNNPEFYPRPLMGVSIGVARTIKTGTMGSYMYDTESEQVVGLTNAHVVLSNILGEEVVHTLPVYATPNTEIRQCSDRDFYQMAWYLELAVVNAVKRYKRTGYSGDRALRKLVMRVNHLRLHLSTNEHRRFGSVLYGVYGPKDGFFRDMAIFSVDTGVPFHSFR